MSILVDSGATYNFIDAHLVERRGIQITTFEGFSVLVLGDKTIQCTRYVPSMTLTMRNYSMTNHFFETGRLKQQTHLDILALLEMHQAVFGEITPGRPPDKGYEHTIKLEDGVPGTHSHHHSL